MTFKNLIYILLFSSFNICISREIVVQNATGINNLYWNYALKIINQDVPLHISRHLHGNEKNIFKDTQHKKFLKEIIVKINPKVIKTILENIGKSTQDQNVTKVYIEIRAESQGELLEPLIRIALTGNLHYEKIKIFLNHGKFVFTDISEGDDCCSSCIVS